MTMNKLAKQAIDAHGGLERWNGFATLSAQLIQGGALWAAKGKGGVLAADASETNRGLGLARKRTA